MDRTGIGTPFLNGQKLYAGSAALRFSKKWRRLDLRIAAAAAELGHADARPGLLKPEILELRSD